MKKRNVNKIATVGDLDDLASQIITGINETLKNYATKDDIKLVATKEDIKNVATKLEGKIDNVASDVSDIRRRVIDLEMDHVTRREFIDLKKQVIAN